jgi:RES domain-containing protein
MPAGGRVHERAILDVLEGIGPTPFEGAVWRTARTGRDPLRGSSAGGRWSPGEVEVLYTSLVREGSLAEVGYRLSLEPVWPSRIAHQIHRIEARAGRVLRLADVASLTPLGIDASRYESFDYAATQAIAAAAHFLEFDGLLVPSARYDAENLVLFTDRLAADALILRQSEDADWAAWRKARRR